MIRVLTLSILLSLARTAAQAEGPPPISAVGVLEKDGARECSAVLIAQDLLVTAAHCVAGTVLATAGGESRVRFHTGSYPGHRSVTREATEIMVHPLYRITRNEAQLAADIAILRLDEPVPNEAARPIPTTGPIVMEEKLLVATWPGGQATDRGWPDAGRYRRGQGRCRAAAACAGGAGRAATGPDQGTVRAVKKGS